MLQRTLTKSHSLKSLENSVQKLLQHAATLGGVDHVFNIYETNCIGLHKCIAETKTAGTNSAEARAREGHTQPDNVGISLFSHSIHIPAVHASQPCDLR